jgi:hypothetical protein
MESGSKMRHLMWILTWIAVGIGGALGAASVIMLSGTRTPPAQQTPEAVGQPKDREPVLVTKPRPGSPGRSLIRPARPLDRGDLLD